MRTLVKAGVAVQGEPIPSLFEPPSLAARVRELGFAQVWDFGPAEANVRYFAGRADGLQVADLNHLMKARV